MNVDSEISRKNSIESMSRVVVRTLDAVNESAIPTTSGDYDPRLSRGSLTVADYPLPRIKKTAIHSRNTPGCFPGQSEKSEKEIMDDQEKMALYQRLQEDLKDSLIGGGAARQRRKKRTKDQLVDSSQQAWAEANRPSDETRVTFRAPAELINLVDQMREEGESRKDWLISAINDKILTYQDDMRFPKLKM